MSNEFLDNESGDLQIKPETDKEENNDGIPTDVKDVFADGIEKNGHNEFPVFKCSKNEFYSNMTDNRKKMRFKSGSTIQQYMQKTRYKRAFFISYTDDNGKTYKRRIK